MKLKCDSLNKKNESTKNQIVSRLALPSLLISQFAIGCPSLLVGLLLIDIGITFGLSVGVSGQLNTFSAFISFIASLLMGVLSTRNSSKTLLLTGTTLFILGTFGCAFASQFSILSLFYALAGFGISMIMPMISTIVAELYELKKRATIIGYTMASGALSFVIGSPIIIYIASLGGWRSPFLYFILPTALLSAGLSVKGLPSSTQSLKSSSYNKSFLESFREILTKRSAMACLFGTALSAACWQAIVFYSVSFLRQRFLLSSDFSSLFIVFGALSYTVGSLVSGWVVNKFGRKTVTVISSVLAGVFTIWFLNVSSLWESISLAFLGSLFSGVRASSSSSLSLEQIPKYRGVIMSLSSATGNIGIALGSSLGGFTLLWYNYEMLGLSLGVIGILAAIIYQLFVIDPVIIQPKRQSY